VVSTRESNHYQPIVFYNHNIFCQSTCSCGRTTNADVADDDALTPSRPRHPVVTSPMSAEASFLSIHFGKEVNERQRFASAAL